MSLHILPLTLSWILFFITVSEGSISFISFDVTFFSTLAISFFISLSAFVLCSSVSFCLVSRLSTFDVKPSILRLFPLTSLLISEMSAIIFLSILVTGSSIVSTGVFLTFLLNFAFSLLVSFRFLWFLYMLASWSNLDVVSFTLMPAFGDGGFFLFLEFESSLFGSFLILLRERLLLSLYFVISFSFSSFDVEGTCTSS